MTPSLPNDVIALSIEELDQRKDRFERTLSGYERNAYAALKIHKRRTQWLGGRWAAKRAVQRALGLPFEAIEIRTGERGRPFAARRGGEPLAGWLSIAHAGDLAAACWSDEPVGIDVERVEPREASFEEVAFSAAERRAFDAAGGCVAARAERVTVEWCKKEALAKWLGTGLAIAFHDLRIELLCTGQARPRVATGFLVHRGERMAWASVRGGGAA